VSARRVVLVGLACALAAGCGGRKGEKGKDQPFRIAFVPKGTTHSYWRTIHAGAQKAVADLAREGVKVELVWKGPLREDDREQQVQVVESFASQGMDGIVLAPLDRKALVRPVEEAKRLGVPVVIVDSALDSDAIASFVATDNGAAGALAADEMGRLLGGRGRVLLVRFQEGSASTGMREEGFLTRLREGWPDVRVVSSDQYAGPTRDTGKRAAENVLNRFGREIEGVAVVNETSADGMLLALQDGGLAGRLKFVGFDASPAFVEALRSGQMHAFVLQDPFRMAETAVRTLIEHLQGRPVKPRIDTRVVIVSPANLESAEIKDLLSPPLAQYLGPGE
jgi:ribose transport system substrate-binding protein